MWKDMYVKDVLPSIVCVRKLESAPLWILLGAHLSSSLCLFAFFFSLAFLVPVNVNH